MINRFKAYCKGLYNRLFKQKTISDNVQSKNKHVIKMNDLKMKLDVVNIAYTNRIAKKQEAYKVLSFKYDEAFKKYSTVRAKYKNSGITNEKELTIQEDQLKPIEEELKKVNEELSKLKESKKREVLKLANDMNSLKEKYLEAKAEEIKRSAYQLQKIKLTYLEKLTSVGTDVREVMEVDSIIKDNLAFYGFNYTEKLAGQLAFYTRDVPITIDNFSVDAVLTANTINGEAIPYELYEVVEKGKFQNYIK